MCINDRFIHILTQGELVRKIIKCNGVLVTSYTTLVIHQDALLPYDWHYVVLDEGHKIRNPDAQATLVCKQVNNHLWKKIELIC